MRGTPHVHSLVCISHDGIGPETAESDDPYAIQALKQLVKKTVTAKLINRHNTDDNELPEQINDRNQRLSEETQYNWAPHKLYFDDTVDPRRLNFNPILNYYRNDQGYFADGFVQSLSRRLQLANQIHRCCFTCFKYCKDADNICRFCFPWPQNENSAANDVMIVKDRDKKHRVRLRIIPERDNAHLNPTFHSPLLICAHGGNCDIQYIMNTHGAAEYSAGYASKAEAPDQKKLQAIFLKSIANLTESNSMVTDRQRLIAAGKSVVGSTHVGSVQAIYFILNQDFVISSRTVISLNPYHGKQTSYTAIQHKYIKKANVKYPNCSFKTQ